jgi:hypothetical protein
MFFRGKAFAIFWNLEPAKSWSRELTMIWNLEPAKPRSREHAIIWNLEHVKPRSREHAMIWNLEPVKPRSREHATVWYLEPAKSRTSGDGKFGNLSEVWFGSHEQENSQTSMKQSQSCRLKKSMFRVWTSGRLVNVWDEKDICVCVHIRNILWARGCFRNVKVPSSPYKRGREGMCNGIHNFGSLSSLWEILSLLSRHHCTWTSLLFSLSHVFGDLIRIFEYHPPNTSKTKHNANGLSSLMQCDNYRCNRSQKTWFNYSSESR